MISANRFFLLLILSSQWLVAQEKANLELLDIFNFEYVSEPSISPDGNQIVYVRNSKDVMTDKNLSNLWIVNFDGTKNRPLTTGNQNDFSPQWSKDGKKLLFKSNMQDDKMKLFMMWMDTKAVLPLTNLPQSPGAVAWSNDSEYIAFTMFVPESSESLIKMPSKPEGAKWNSPPIYIDKMNYRGDGQGYLKPGYTQLFMLSTDGGSPRQLTDSKYDHGSPSWSADGKKLYFSANLKEGADLDPMNSEVYQLDIKTKEVKAITSRQGPDGGIAISPDGKSIAYLGFDDKLLGYQISDLYVMNSDGTNSKLVSGDFDRDIGNIKWDEKGNGLYYQYDDNGDTKVGHIGLNGKNEVIVEGLGGLSLGRPYNAGDFSVSNDGKLAFTLGGPDHPSDLGVSENGKIRRLTSLNDDLFSFKNTGKVEEIRWKSSYDQREIQGWIVTPPNFDPNKKYPFILEIHGGPFASYGNEFSAEIQLYAASGYVVLYSNPRGSSGYGAEFGNLIHHDYPNHDYEDLMSGVDAVIAREYVDAENLFVTGGSGGGVLTAWIVGHTDRFKAAVVAKPVINWYSFVLYADNPGFFSKYWFPNKPWEDPEPYLKRSPISYVGNVTTPTMLLTGEEDYRTPIAESEQFYTALKLEGVESAMVRIPNSGHGIADKPSNLIAKIASVLAWFEKYRTNK